MTFHALCSIEAGTSTVWCAQLLAHSWRRADQPEPLTFLSAGGLADVDPDFEVVQTEQASEADGNHYPPYNKPSSIAQWLLVAQPPDDLPILVLDPDMVVLERFQAPGCGPGRAVAHGPWAYHDNPDYLGITSDEISRRCRSPELLQSVGVPLLICAGDLRATLQGWMDHTWRLRRAGLPRSDPWCAEMVGYCMAAAEQGIRHQMSTWGEEPLLHYMGASPGALYLEPWVWNKYSHRPWDPLPPLPSDAPLRAHRFAALYNELRSRKLGELA